MGQGSNRPAEPWPGLLHLHPGNTGERKANTCTENAHQRPGAVTGSSLERVDVIRKH